MKPPRNKSRKDEEYIQYNTSDASNDEFVPAIIFQISGWKLCRGSLCVHRVSIIYISPNSSEGFPIMYNRLLNTLWLKGAEEIIKIERMGASFRSSVDSITRFRSVCSISPAHCWRYYSKHFWIKQQQTIKYRKECSEILCKSVKEEHKKKRVASGNIEIDMNLLQHVCRPQFPTGRTERKQADPQKRSNFARANRTGLILQISNGTTGICISIILRVYHWFD